MVCKPVVRAVLTGRLTVSGFHFAWFSSLSSECLCVFALHDAIKFFLLNSLTFTESGGIGR